MTQIVTNRFNNHSGPGDYLGGNRSKFTESQAEERLKIHALAIATGYPTIKQIVAGWKDRFGIEITEQSEKEWRKTNRNRIEKRKQELIDTGDIEVPVVSDRALSDSLMTAMIQNGRFIADVQKRARLAMGKISIEGAGTDKDVSRKNKELVMIFSALAEAAAKTSAGMTKQFAMMSDISGRVKSNDAKNEKDDEFQEKLAESEKEDEELNPADVEVSEEDRKLLGQN